MLSVRPSLYSSVQSRLTLLFRDIEFDLAVDKDHCLNGLDLLYGFNPTDTMRVTEIFDHPRFYVNGAATSGVAQGVLGDCSFLSELAVIATIGLVEEICVEVSCRRGFIIVRCSRVYSDVQRDEEIGIYGFIFWKNSQWVAVVVDEYGFSRSCHTAELILTCLSLLYVKYLHWSELTKKVSGLLILEIVLCSDIAEVLPLRSKRRAIITMKNHTMSSFGMVERHCTLPGQRLRM